MMEADTFHDTPVEAKVIAPRIFQVPREISPSRSRSYSYKDFTISKLLNKAKFPVYLVKCKGFQQDFAMKVFPHEERTSQQYFENEVRFTALRHENIARVLNTEQNKIINYKGESKKVSLILMEYAPFGDLYDFITKYKQKLTDKLIRTYFKQLIQGLEYLQSQGVGHLDIKLENLLLGENYMLKIADFDLSAFENDTDIITRGTQFFRAPELLNQQCKNPFSADIYSAGIILFVLKSRGVIPHAEEQFFKGIDLLDLLYNNNQEFWRVHCEIQKDSSYFSSDFIELINGMINPDPEERFTISEIKSSKWFGGPVFSYDELKKHLDSFISI